MIRPLLVTLALASPVFARIGETPEQCEDRYGKPIDSGANQSGIFKNTYRQGGVAIDCFFQDGTCARIGFFTIQASVIDGDNSWAQFTPEQIMKLLESNSGGMRWDRDGGTDRYPIYKTSDNSRRAKTGSTGVNIELVSWAKRNQELLEESAIGKVIESF